MLLYTYYLFTVPFNEAKLTLDPFSLTAGILLRDLAST